MAIIKNGMSRVLRIDAPRIASSLIITPTKPMAGSVSIPPFGEAEVPFWDEVKKYPMYQRLLELKKISDDGTEPNGEPHFTSNGDTLKAPERMDPSTVKEDSEAQGVKNLQYKTGDPDIRTKRGKKA